MSSTTTVPASSTSSPESKRGSAWLLTLISIVMAMLIGGIIIAFSDEVVRKDLQNFSDDPGAFFRDFFLSIRDAYLALFDGAIFNRGNDGSLAGILGPISSTVYQATPLILGGLAVALAFRTGLFNIGAEGQVIAGAFCSGFVGFAVELPAFIHLPLALVAGVAGGALWGFIAGFLKARSGAHEVITTIMLNWIAKYLLAWLLTLKFVVNPQNSEASKEIVESARIPQLLGNSLRINWGIILALVAAAGVWWLLTRSTLGLRLRAVGANAAAAKTAGIGVGSMTMVAMTFAGGLAGLAGTTLSLGGATTYVVTPTISSNVGFDAITVALLGRSSPWGVVGAGLLFGALRQGGSVMQATAGVQTPIDIITVIQALIVMFVAAPLLVKAIVRIKKLGAAGLGSAATNLVTSVSIARKARIPRHIFVGSLQVVVGVVVLVLWGLSERAGRPAVLNWAMRGDRVHLPTWTFDPRMWIIAAGILIIVAGIGRLLRYLGARTAVALVVAGVLVAFVLWSIAGSVTGFQVVRLLQGAVFPGAVALTLGALAGVIGERAGVVNIAIEGQLLGGAFLAAVVGTITGSAWLGLISGAAAGLLVGALLAVIAIRYFVDQVIVGVVLNVLVLGLTSFFFTKLLSPHADTYNQPDYFKVWKVPVLGDIPIIGNVFFKGTIFLYLTYVLVAVVHYSLFHTRWGLRLRAVGEHPRAADTMGIKVLRTRYRAVWLGGMIAGLGGAFLVIGTGSQGTFGLNMSAGNGFIALACVIFGRWRPVGAVAAALLFGFMNQLQALLAQAGSPVSSSLLLALPYVVVLFVVAGSVGRVRSPAADGQPYKVGG